MDTTGERKEKGVVDQIKLLPMVEFPNYTMVLVNFLVNFNTNKKPTKWGNLGDGKYESKHVFKKLKRIQHDSYSRSSFIKIYRE